MRNSLPVAGKVIDTYSSADEQNAEFFMDYRTLNIQNPLNSRVLIMYSKAGAKLWFHGISFHFGNEKEIEQKNKNQAWFVAFHSLIEGKIRTNAWKLNRGRSKLEMRRNFLTAKANQQ